MANKAKKKRNKQYRGADAAMTRPSVTRISAANRSKVGQWWFERKRILKPVLIAAAVIVGLGVLIYELIRVVTQ
jgi:Ni/Fe-hydrogenase subunit HybB-like protein